MRGGVGWMLIRGIFPRLLTGRLAAREGRSRRRVVKIPVKPLEPPSQVLVMVNMVLGPSTPPLSFPGRKKKGFRVNGSVDFDVLAQARASRAIQRAQPA